jgi:SAM-dependent methyltransferase
MIKQFLAFLLSTKQNDMLLKFVVLLAILFFILTRNKPHLRKEGFEQREKFVLKRDTDAYDDFYAPVYEHLYDLPKQSSLEIKEIVSSTQPNPQKSVMLDAGCGTGLFVSKLRDAGFTIYGIDKSEEMVKYSKMAYPGTQIKCGDVLNPLEFERSTFTHITCMNFTIYSFKNKALFFRNCQQWLVPHGYLFLHLVNPNKFDPITPAGKPALLDNPQTYAKERITSTAIDFDDFKYRSSFDFNQLGDNGMVTHTETFTDISSGHVRQNEHMLYMVDEKVILALAERCGFVLKGQFNVTKDKHQSVYIMEKVA